MKRRVLEAIIVEGRYDKNKLKQIVDAQVIETGGFGVFHNDELKSLLRILAEKKGIIILTDSDGAGFVIRNHLRGVLPRHGVKHAYIPEIKGKERRKPQGSKAGLLGVEGVAPEIIIAALERAGATFFDAKTKPLQNKITKADLFIDGLCGGIDSEKKRQKFLKFLNLPMHMSTNAMLEAINLLLNEEEYRILINATMIKNT